MRLARPCKCARPLWDGENCVRCGHIIYGAPERDVAPARGRNAWTRAGVTRAIKAFVFFRGRAPMIADWESAMESQWPTLQVVQQLFGSFSAAVEAAGVAQTGPA